MTLSISLITICWNAGETLKRTLDSVLAQSRLPLEYLLVDGGSTDDTPAILNEYQPRFAAKGVAMTVQPQHRVPGEAGIPNAWNQALQLVQGDIIAMLNADDWYDPGAFQTIADCFETTGAEAVVCPIRLVGAAPEADRLFAPRPWSKMPLLMPVPHPGCFFRRSVYERLGKYDTRYKISADYDFIWRCRQAGIRWAFLPHPLVNMQQGGLANTSRACARRETYSIARKYVRWYDLRPAAAFFLRWLACR